MYSVSDAFNMSDNNDGQGKYECPEDHEVFENSFEFGRHVRNNHRGTKVKPIINGIEEIPKVEVKGNPVTYYDLLQKIMLDAGVPKGTVSNLRITFENYDYTDLNTLEGLLREYGLNKSTKTQILSAYSSRLGVDLPEPTKEVSDNDLSDNYTEKLVKDRVRRHQLFVQAKTSGMDNEDLNLLFPEFAKEKNEKPQADAKKTYIFPPTPSGQPMQLTDSEYASLYNQWMAIKSQNQQPASDIEYYKEISENLKSLGLNSSQRPVKDELSLQMWTKSLDTIAKRLDKTEPLTSLVSNVIGKLNDSGRLPSMIDNFLSRHDGQKPAGMPIRNYSEADFQKMNEKMEEPKNIYTQTIQAEKSEEKQQKSSPTQMGIDHITGKPVPTEEPYANERKTMEEEYDLTPDEITQILSNVRSAKDMKKIMDTLRRAKNGN
jgi:hypothetical protein